MRVVRRSKIPAIYLTIPWIRKSRHRYTGWCDCIEDADYTLKMKAVCKGEKCHSVFDRLSEFLIIGDFPENWNEFNCTSGQVAHLRTAKWKAWDVLYLLDNQVPAEAISLLEAGLTRISLETLAKPVSCIPILTKLKIDLEFADITEKQIKEIQELEASLFRQLQIQQLKGSERMKDPQDKASAKTARRISSRLRQNIFSRDGYCCVLCGKASTQTELEVDHIIPVSLINRLDLPRELYDAEFNLCTSCIRCNRGKSDHLSQEAIIHYIQTFENSAHPNNGSLPFLLKIRDLQQSGEA